jgi:hypothetical protein
MDDTDSWYWSSRVYNNRAQPGDARCEHVLPLALGTCQPGGSCYVALAALRSYMCRDQVNLRSRQHGLLLPNGQWCCFQHPLLSCWQPCPSMKSGSCRSCPLWLTECCQTSSEQSWIRWPPGPGRWPGHLLEWLQRDQACQIPAWSTATATVSTGRKHAARLSHENFRLTSTTATAGDSRAHADRQCNTALVCLFAGSTIPPWATCNAGCTYSDKPGSNN